MTKEEHARIFDSIKNGFFNFRFFFHFLDKFDDFWLINKKLMGSASDSVDTQMNNVPLRFYFVSSLLML